MLNGSKQKAKSEDDSKKGRMFSIDLVSRNSIKNASIDNERRHGVLLEGSLGELRSANFREDGSVFEIAGTEGVLRVDLRRDELVRANVERDEQ